MFSSILRQGWPRKNMAFTGKEHACNAGDTRDPGSISGLEDPLEEATATRSGIFAWEIPRTEEPGMV